MKTKARMITAIFLGLLVALMAQAVPLCALGFTPLDRDAVVAAAQTVTGDRYPNAEVVHLDQRTWIRYQADGTYVQWYESYVKILTEKGRRQYKSVSSSFTIPYNTTRFTVVEVIRSDGTALAVDIDTNSREMVEQSQMDSNIYNPNDRVLRVSIPEVNVGDVVHFIMSDDFTKARMPGTWSDYVTLEGTEPIRHLEYTVVAPKELPLKSVVLKAEIPGTITSSTEDAGAEIVYTWVAADVPRAFEEPQMPKLYTQAQRLLISTLPDWETVSRWYWNLSEPHIENTTPEMGDKVKELVKGIDDKQKKIETIFQWVSQDIRYLGITAEKDAPGYEPHPASMTFERRSGVCRDKAALLVAMLRLAGFEAFPVLIMNGPKKDPEVPQPYFNHAISAVRMKDRTYQLMDATDESTRDLFPAYLNNQSYLVATPEGETLLTSPITPAGKNMMHIVTSASLDDRGDLKAHSVLRFEGINDNAYRGFFSRSSPEEIRQYLERIIKRIAPGGVLTAYDMVPANMLDTTRGLVANISFEVKNYLIRGTDTLMLPLVRMGGSIGMVNFITREMGLKERRYPYVTDVACGIDETFTLDLGQSVGKAVSPPTFLDVDNEGATWKRSVTVAGGIMTSSNVFALKLPEYSPQEYRALKQTLAGIDEDARKMPVFSSEILSTTQGEQQWYEAYRPDAVILDEVVEFDVEDASNWTETKKVKMQVLTYAGKKRYSDLYVRYNPVWEEVKIESAVVTSPSGGVKVIEDKEMNVMDAAWAADAPRYPGSKILVVSLPGVVEGSIIEYTIIRKKTGRELFSINGEFCLLDQERIENERGASSTTSTVDGALRYREPIGSKTLRIKIPEGMHLVISGDDAAESALLDLPVAEVHRDMLRDGPKVIYEFTASDVPPVMEEALLPPWYSFNPMIFASSGTWNRYAQAVRTTLEKAASSQKKTEALARDLIAGVDQDDMKILRIRDFVAKNIKPIDVAFGELPLSYASPADRTLTDGYGNSADRAIVLLAMLRAAGFEPELVLASWVSPVERLKQPLYRFVLPEWFSDVLVRVGYDGRRVYLNDTDQYAALGNTRNANHPGLVLKSGEFETILNASADLDDRTDVTIRMELGKQGDVVLKKTRTLYGQDFASFNKRFREMPPEERSRHHQELVSAISKQAVAQGEYRTDYQSYPGIEEFSLSAQAYATRQGTYLYLDLPGLVGSLEGVNTEMRKNPIFRSSYHKGEISLEVLLPAGVESVQVLPPEKLTLQVKGSGAIDLETMVVYREGDSEPSVVKIRQRLDLAPALIQAEGYPELLEANRILSYPGSRMVVVEME